MVKVDQRFTDQLHLQVHTYYASKNYQNFQTQIYVKKNKKIT